MTLFLETAPQRAVTDVYVRNSSHVTSTEAGRSDSAVNGGPATDTGDDRGGDITTGGAERAGPPPKTPLPPAVYLAELDALARSLGY